jgi:protein-tyrosine phosphatase
VFRHAVTQAGLDRIVRCDSAGTHDYHVGEPPDARAQRAALKRGYDMSALRARQVDERDFETFDHIVAMDNHNLAALERMCPPQHAHKLALLCDSHEDHAGREVPDPYYGGERGFEQVLDLIEAATPRLLEHVRKRAGC